MFGNFLGWFKYVFVVFMLLVTTGNVMYAEELSPEGKILFVYADNIGETSYYISDVLSNDNIMGLSILNKKLAQLQFLVKGQVSLVGHLNLSKKTIDCLDKFNKEVDLSFKNYDYDRKKLLVAKDTFALYSESLRDDIEKQYGPKLTWLFDITFLASFTEQSMSSDYKNKLVLLQFAYLLDYIPYKLPTSVVSSVSNVVAVDDENLTSTQVDLIREASQNVLNYFSNPTTYTPPTTLTDLVGKWEGRLSTPDGVYHKAEIEINPDLSAVINVENIFKSMPIDAISLTQTAIAFNVKPYGDESLTIKFTGRIVDDVVSGEAVDITGKKGLWQFMKVSKLAVDDISADEISNEPACLDKLVGVWKGKILEENGAISNATLNFDLVDDPVLLVENANTSSRIPLGSLAANDKGIKFSVKPKGAEDLNIIFIGKLNGLILEGNAEDKNGSRGYWKLVKVSEKTDKSEINYDYLNELCDPIIVLNDNPITFVANQKVIVPTGKINEGLYKGYMLFSDGAKVEIVFDLNSKTTKMFLISKEDNSKVELTVSDLNITDRKIDFKTTIEGDVSTAVEFKGKVFSDYIYGTAINAMGQELEWELMSVKKTGDLLSDVAVLSPERIKGSWNGELDFAGLVKQPVSMVISEEKNYFLVSENDKLDIDEVLLDANVVSFIAHDAKEASRRFIFNGTFEDGEIIGKITTVDGLGLNVKLSFSDLEKKESVEDVSKPEKSVVNKSIWKGDIGYGDSRADIVFDFTKDDKLIYIDDFNADTGRVKLQVSDYVLSQNALKFKAKAFNDPTTVEFTGSIADKIADGTARNQLDGSKVLTWKVNKSELGEYVPGKISHKKRERKDSFSFMHEMAPVEDIKTEKEPKEVEIKEDIVKKVAKKEDKADTKSDNKVKNENKKTKSDKKKEKDVPKEHEITDESMYKQSEIDNAQKQIEKHEKGTQKDSDKKSENKKDKEFKEKKSLKKEKVLDADKEKAVKKPEEKSKNVDKKLETKPEVEVKQVEQEKTEEKEVKEKKQVIIKTDDGVKPLEQEKKPEKEVNFDDFKGKWVGEVENPSQDKGEMILEVKKDAGYIYVDKEGEKVPFKLFDFSIEGSKIYFTLKPSPDNDYGIRFEGALIQGVLSGVAIGPDGKKGKWYAKRI